MSSSSTQLLDSTALEAPTQRYGREIFARMHGNFRLDRLRPAKVFENVLLGVLMRDEALKTGLLRFVDTYPSLGEADEIVDHLRQYLPGVSRATAAPFHTRALTRLLRSDLVPSSIVSRVCGRAIRAMGRHFIAGKDPISIAPRLKAMERRGLTFSLDLLGEHVSSRAQADRFAARYLEMIEHLNDRLSGRPTIGRESTDLGPRVNISIKLSSLTHKFDPLDREGTTQTVLVRLRALLRAAADRGVFLNIDTERYDYRDLTLEIVKRILSEPEFEGVEHIGTVFQAYLTDAEDSLRRFLAWLAACNQPMTIRLVKGAYWDSECIWASQRGWPCPVFTEKQTTDVQFEKMTRLLLENSAVVRTAIASHNVRSIAHALAARDTLAIPPENFEVQLLFGMADDLSSALLAMDLHPRIYVPCGEIVPGMAYLVRRLLENTANESFLRHRAIRDISPDGLLRDPAAAQV